MTLFYIFLVPFCLPLLNLGETQPYSVFKNNLVWTSSLSASVAVVTIVVNTSSSYFYEYH